MPAETKGRQGGERWETALPLELRLRRNPAPAASATCRDTPGSPVLSGDRFFPGRCDISKQVLLSGGRRG